jgi:hypothetical protein
LCRSTHLGEGCGHPTRDHTGIDRTPNKVCCCCTWLHNDMGHVQTCLDCAIKHGKRQCRIRRISENPTTAEVEPFIPESLRRAFWERYIGKYFNKTLGA